MLEALLLIQDVPKIDQFSPIKIFKSQYSLLSIEKEQNHRMVNN